MRALVGHSGFVGRHLARQRRWDAFFDRQNIDSIRGRRFELLVCAGLPADRWRANGNPGGDRSNMLSLAGALAEAKADRVVLVSTVDVYPVPIGVDESTPIDTVPRQAFGEHRLEFERRIAARFAVCHVLRLPTAFGAEMARNVLDDLIRRRDLDGVDPCGLHQWYPVSRLADDLDLAIAHGLPVVNLCSEPLEAARLHREFFEHLKIGARPVARACRDVRTRYGRLFGGNDRYPISADEAVKRIGEWLRAQPMPGPLGALRNTTALA
jgi:nucleoside-diphosphate-sugar epimerase